MNSHAPARFVFNCFFSLLCVLSSFTIYGQTFAEAGFSSELITTLPVYQPVGLGFAPDGRLFIWQEKGIVRIYKNGTLLTTPFIDISDHVNTVNDRGLLGLTFDPDFTTNGYIYLFYTYEPNGNPNDTGAKTGRITRIKADPANPDVALSGETIILGKLSATPCAPNTDCLGNDRDSHSGGTLRFGPDRKLYISTGDSAAYNFAEDLSLRSQNLDYLNGKILRLNADGTAPSDNPFYDGTNSVKSKVYSLGLRNPYRFAIHPTSGEILIGDVGWSAYEEINRATRGANFGWPCFEGDAAQPTFASTFPATCGAIPVSSITNPLFFYPHSDGQAIIGGTIYTASQFPAKFKESFFFADYPSKWIKRAVFDANRKLLSVEPFATNAGSIVSLEQGPDGSLYYIELDTGKIKRIRFASAPNAVASASPTSGSSPLTVSLSSNGSSDPNNLALTYAWDFGDGSTSIAANPVHTYTSSVFKIFTATLKVTNSNGGSSSTTVNISVGNRTPTATITAPANGFIAKPGDTISYTGTASDPDESLGTNSMSWQVLLHHDTHVHPYTVVTGAGGSFVVENHGTIGTYYYEIILTVTDSKGASDSKSININIAAAGNQAPTVNLSTPSNGASFNAPANVALSVTAADSDGTISKIEIFNGANLLATLTTAPYQFSWSNVAAGNYSLTAKATDNGGLSTTSAAVQIYVIGPSSPTTYLSNLNWIEAFNGWGDIERDRSNGELDPNDGKVLTLAGKTYPKGLGVHADSNVAYNLNGVYSTFTAEIGIDDEVGDNGSVIFQVLGDDVVLFESGILLGSSPTQIISVDVRGKNELRLKVLSGDDGNGYDHADWADAKLLTQTTANMPPIVALTTPANNAIFNAPATIQLSASASDSDGTISRVEFYQGASLLGSATAAPYNFTWNNVAGGNYALTAKAFDDKGAMTTSSIINVTVKANVLPTVSVTAPANNASFAAPATVTINANAADSDGSITKVEFYQGTILLGSDTTAPYSFIWSNVTIGNYQITAVATDNLGAKTTSAITNISVTNLPAGWRNQDIGNPALRGSANFATGIFTLSSSGADIWDYSDSFHFAWQSFTGDGQITARVVSLDNTNSWAKAGIMIRDSLAATSAHGMMVITAGNGAAFQWRLANPGNMGNQSIAGLKAPYWVRIVRQGDILRGYRSSNGTTWTLVSTQTIFNLSATASFGLVVTSHDDGVIANAKFDNVTISR